MRKGPTRIALGLIVLAAGCGRDEVFPVDAVRAADAPPVADAPPTADAPPRICDTADGTADITATGGGGGTIHYGRLHAGAVWEVGPVAPPAAGPAVPMMMSVLFTDANPISADTAGCCMGGIDSCCGTIGLYANTASIPAGTEVGDHSVTFYKSDDATYSVPGTLTITTFEDPFPTAPGRIAGSITGTMGGRTVGGTFDNQFCVSLLTATI